MNTESLDETKRANRERERQTDVQLGETAQHNRATEDAQLKVIAETGRHNLASELEANRHNLESERVAVLNFNETARANLEREALQRQANEEAIRSHMATERLSADQIAENKRANQAREGIQRSQLAETIRFNDLTNTYRIGSLNEQSRSNLANEQLTRDRNEETKRANIANEVIAGANQVTNAGYLAERVRSDLAREAETALHNRAMELKDYSPKTYIGGDTSTVPGLPSPTNTSSGKTEPVVLNTVITGSSYSGSNRRTVRSGYDVMSDGTRKYFTEEVGFDGKAKKTYK